MTDLVVVTIKSGKKVNVPRVLFENGHKLSARAYAVETGQATWAEVNGEELPKGMQPSADNPFDAAAIGAGRTIMDIGSNIKQAAADLPFIGSKDASGAAKSTQSERARLHQPVESDYPISSFVGSTLPYFAVPGGKVAQMGAGALQGALEGDTLAGRLGGAALGAGLAFGGQKAGDYVGAKAQNAVQRLRGSPNAGARSALMKSGVPLNLSERFDDGPSKTLTRFFERSRFVLTGNQPKGAAQQVKLTELVTDALGINGKKLTRETLGKAVNQNDEVFKTAASRVQGNLLPDTEFTTKANKVINDFYEASSDSPQVIRIFNQFEDFASNPNGITPQRYLKLRSNLSEATTKSDIETTALVDAINSMDERLAREVPELAADLVTARDRFRLLLAVRRGAALSPQGDINVGSFTKNLERVFRDFDVGKPLPRGLADAGESIAGFNQIATPFRSSGTAENAIAGGFPGAAATAEPSAVIKFLMGTAAPFAGGGAGGLLGGGAGRSLAQTLLDNEI